MVRLMQRLLLLWALVWLPPLAAQTTTETDPLQKEVALLVSGPKVTVVHFWAPWCPNSKAEMTTDGWAKTIAANPEVKFVFLAVWHKGQNPAPVLKAAALGAQPNLVVRTHLNPSRLEEDRLNTFLGLPITWVPTTWVFRAGQLRYALNYGEVRFPLLQQMIEDSREAWERE